MDTKFPEIYGDFALGRWADHLHTRRWRAGLTTRQLGKMMQKSASMISRWENRLSVPTVPDFLWICRYFDMSPWDYTLANPAPKTEFNKVFEVKENG